MAEHAFPVTAPPSTPADPPSGSRGWRRHGWTLGGLLALTAVGGWWWRRRRRARAEDLPPVSERWLMEHEYESGQKGAEE